MYTHTGEAQKAQEALAKALGQARYLPEILDALVFQKLAELQQMHHPYETHQEGGEGGDEN